MVLGLVGHEHSDFSLEMIRGLCALQHKYPSTNILLCAHFRYTIAPNCAQACVTM